MTSQTPSALDQKVRRRLSERRIDGPTALMAALRAVGHITDRSQALRWLQRSITPRPAAIRALSRVLDLPPADLAAWFLEAALYQPRPRRRLTKQRMPPQRMHSM